MLSASSPKALWRWIPGLAILLLAGSALMIWRNREVAARYCSDCDEIYKSVLRQHQNDDQWMRTHVLLKMTDGSRFIASGLVGMRSRLPWFERLMYWRELDTFLAQRDGEPLSYVEGKGLRVISSIERGEMLKRGITVLTFTQPGFSFDHRHAVLFVSAERHYSVRETPFFGGSLIYLKKIGGRWVVDHPHGLPELHLVT